jgi:hypothetical protein
MNADLYIVELTENEIQTGGDCILVAFKYMVEDRNTGGRWFGSNNKEECEEYILKHLNYV